MYSVPWKISNMDCFAKMVRYWKGFWTHHSSYFWYTMLPNAFLVALRKFQTMLCFTSLVDHRCKKTNIKTNKKETENETNRNLRNKKTKQKLSVLFNYTSMLQIWGNFSDPSRLRACAYPATLSKKALLITFLWESFEILRRSYSLSLPDRLLSFRPKSYFIRGTVI